MRMPQGCGNLSGEVVRLNKSRYGSKQASRSCHAYWTTCLQQLGFQQCFADASVFRFEKQGHVAITAVIYVDDIFDVGRKSRCGYFCEDLCGIVPVKNLRDLGWYGGCQFSGDRQTGVLTISQKTLADPLVVEKIGVVGMKSISMPVEINIEEFSQDGHVGTWPFRELIGSLMWLASQTRPDIAHAVRAVARYCAGPRKIHWKTALLGISANIKSTSGYGKTFQRVLMDGLQMEVFADAD